MENMPSILQKIGRIGKLFKQLKRLFGQDKKRLYFDGPASGVEWSRDSVIANWLRSYKEAS